MSYFFPKNYDRISSRNINYDVIRKNKYDKIFILFAEQRTFLKNSDKLFDLINFTYTINVIDNLKDYCDKIILYSTSELWNLYNSCVSIDYPYFYNETPYIKSKEKLCNHIKNNKTNYSNVIIVYPFNFNSIYRKEGFLFSKIFDSILNNKKIEIGEVDFNRDFIHPKTIVDYSIKTDKDILIGSGELFNVKKFIKDLFSIYNKNFEDYITLNETHNLDNKRNGYYSCVKYTSYEEIINLTIKDIYEYKIS